MLKGRGWAEWDHQSNPAILWSLHNYTSRSEECQIYCNLYVYSFGQTNPSTSPTCCGVVVLGLVCPNLYVDIIQQWLLVLLWTEDPTLSIWTLPIGIIFEFLDLPDQLQTSCRLPWPCCRWWRPSRWSAAILTLSCLAGDGMLPPSGIWKVSFRTNILQLEFLFTT